MGKKETPLAWTTTLPTEAGRYVVEDPDEFMEALVWTLEPEQEPDDRWVCYLPTETLRRGTWPAGARFLRLPVYQKTA